MLCEIQLPSLLTMVGLLVMVLLSNDIECSASFVDES